MPQMTLAEAVLGAAALGGVTTAVSNNVAQKNNIAQQDKAMNNARAIVSQSQQNMQDWYKKHPQPNFMPGQLPPPMPGAMGNGPATGTGPSPAAVANSVMSRLGPGGAPSPASTPAIPPTHLPGSPMPPNLQAILARLQQQGLAVS